MNSLCSTAFGRIEPASRIRRTPRIRRVSAIETTRRAIIRASIGGFVIVSFHRLQCVPLALAACLFAASLSPAHAALPEIRTLDNGLRVVLLEDHAVPLAAVSLWIGSGSKDEVEESAGYAHFLEHLIQRGTEDTPAFEYTRRAQRWGGALSVRASYDRTTITTSGVPQALDDMIQAVASLAFHATIKDKEVDQELGTLSQEIRTYYDRPSSVALLESMRAAFPTHPYRHPTLGNYKTVGRLKAEPLLAFYRNMYVPGNMALVVAGDFDARAAGARVQTAFGGAPKSALLRAQTTPPNAFPGHSDIEKRVDVQESWTTFAFVGPGYRHPDRVAFEALAAALADASSPLYGSVLKDQVGSVSQVSFYGLEDAGLLYVAINPAAPELSYRAAASAMRALAAFKKAGFSDQAARDLSAGLLRDSWQRTAHLIDRSEALGEAALFGGLRYAWDRPVVLKGLTAADLNRVAAKYLVPDNMRLVVLVPKVTGEFAEDGKKAFHEALDGLGSEGTSGPTGLDATVYGPSESGRLTAEAWGDPKAESRARAPVKTVLKNGFTLVTFEDHRFPTAAVSLHIAGGSGSDPAGREGRAGLGLRLLATRTAQALRDLAPEVARRRSLVPEAQATRDFLEVRASGDPGDVAAAAEAMARALQGTSSPDDFGRVRQAALATLSRGEDLPDAVGIDLFHEKVYSGHPYAFRPDGTSGGLQALTEEDMKAFAASVLRPDRVVLAVAGDIDGGAIGKQVDRLFSPWKPGTSPHRADKADQGAGRASGGGAAGGTDDSGAPSSGKATAHAVTGDFTRQIASPSSHAVVGVATVPLLDPAFAEVRWLGAAVTLRAFEDLVFTRRSVFSVVAIPEGFSEGGALAFEAVEAHARRGEALFELQRQMRALALAEVPENDRRDLGRMLAGRDAAAAEGAQAMASLLAYREAAGLHAESWRADLEPKVPPADRLKAAAERLFQPQRFISIGVGPPSP
jgi:zinc protease